ncbi:hypothetical protein QBC33DRAFT_524993 [Phialemonium atrogriseum]|uniref:Uncharacterized protein n=1 Tax=Phialemonium atrogriseum TaxID=1093897 RepID=A0AAJ0CCM0_9PEZI|nr:uncharacterized protein QBC33DRAFT_524993 [Phialemonium atrogriseum]KAK1771846.1 hypothetical protein QBC33DRAFT_524993 [Phialemonium atrogriseum]
MESIETPSPRASPYPENIDDETDNLSDITEVYFSDLEDQSEGSSPPTSDFDPTEMSPPVAMPGQARGASQMSDMSETPSCDSTCSHVPHFPIPYEILRDPSPESVSDSDEEEDTIYGEDAIQGEDTIYEDIIQEQEHPIHEKDTIPEKDPAQEQAPVHKAQKPAQQKPQYRARALEWGKRRFIHITPDVDSGAPPPKRRVTYFRRGGLTVKRIDRFRINPWEGILQSYSIKDVIGDPPPTTSAAEPRGNERAVTCFQTHRGRTFFRIAWGPRAEKQSGPADAEVGAQGREDGEGIAPEKEMPYQGMEMSNQGMEMPNQEKEMPSQEKEMPNREMEMPNQGMEPVVNPELMGEDVDAGPYFSYDDIEIEEHVYGLEGEPVGELAGVPIDDLTDDDAPAEELYEDFHAALYGAPGGGFDYNWIWRQY